MNQRKIVSSKENSIPPKNLNMKKIISKKNKSNKTFLHFFTYFHKNLTFASIFFTLIILGSIFSIFFLFWKDSFLKPEALPSVITPINVPRVMDLPQFSGSYEEKMLWGTYRPQLYFGIRAKKPKSLLFGMMWLKKNQLSTYSLRHTCEQSDDVSRYGWLKHDGVSYGKQEIVDGVFNIETSFLKFKNKNSNFGGNWCSRLSISKNENSINEEKKFSLFFYVLDENGEAIDFPFLETINENKNIKSFKKEKTFIFASGKSKSFGDWEIQTRISNNSKFYYQSFDYNFPHNLTKFVSNQINIESTSNPRLQNLATPNANFAIIQIDMYPSSEIDFCFSSSKKKNEENIFTGSFLTNHLSLNEKNFDQKFDNVFNTSTDQLNISINEDLSIFDIKKVSKYSLSNLLGGIGYFYGQSWIALPKNHKKDHVKIYDMNGKKYFHYFPSPLFTAVPCRPFFPRGFLWDEGFHQLIINKWDAKLSREIIGHWFDLMNIDGWIPREQILGLESQSKVPGEFILQHTSNANPPALFLPLYNICLKIKKNDHNKNEMKEEIEFLHRLYPRLQKWYDWFNNTQKGKESGCFYWHGRDNTTDKELNPATLMSGLDDYPRASHPGPDECHVDLRCWMYLASEVMRLIADITGHDSKLYEYSSKELSDFDKLNSIHFDTKSRKYFDFGNHTDKVKLENFGYVDPQTGYYHRQLSRSVNERPRLRHVAHFGYNSLFPFLMRLLPHDSDILKEHLEFIRNEKHLWTSFGLRSLSKSSSLYMKYNTEHNSPYWRGSVWININFLTLSSLYYYSNIDGPFKENARLVYDELRSNLIKNIVRRYKESGYLWEQYDNVKAGVGKGAHPFTGWTSLITLIISEMY